MKINGRTDSREHRRFFQLLTLLPFTLLPLCLPAVAQAQIVVDGADLQSLVLAFPEILLATVVFDVVLGKWRGLRLLEYVRFLGAVERRRESLAPAGEPRP